MKTFLTSFDFPNIFLSFLNNKKSFISNSPEHTRKTVRHTEEKGLGFFSPSPVKIKIPVYVSVKQVYI